MSTVNKPRTKVGIVLMTYGSATTADGVAAYFESIHPGKISAEAVKEFERRYALIGRSPLIDITNAQAEALEMMLNGDAETVSVEGSSALANDAGVSYVVRAGMRHSAPTIGSAVAECAAAGAKRLVGIVLSPQFSSFIMDGYRAAFIDAAKAHGFADDAIALAGPWPAQPEFVELLAERTASTLAKIRAESGRGATVVFTTHSLPKRIVERDPSYLEQLAATIGAVRAKLDPALEWRAAYQSAGHSPEEWLKPDLTDILAELHGAEKNAEGGAGAENVLIVPIQFLADHLEILYDLDIAAKAQCDAFGIAYHRIGLPNTDSLFINALASLARATLP